MNESIASVSRTFRFRRMRLADLAITIMLLALGFLILLLGLAIILTEFNGRRETRFAHGIVGALFILGAIRLVWHMWQILSIAFFLKTVDIASTHVTAHWRGGGETRFSVPNTLCQWVDSHGSLRFTVRRRARLLCLSSLWFENGEEMAELLRSKIHVVGALML